jgi:hypothetical protein
MQNSYRNKNNFSSLIKVALISFSIPVVIHLFLKNENYTEKENLNETNIVTTVAHDQNNLMLEQIIIKINSLSKNIESQSKQIESQNEKIQNISSKHSISIPEPLPLTAPMSISKIQLPILEPEVLWLDSPVTQKWQWDSKHQAWMPVQSYKDSMRSTPSVIIGLQDDGTVVWKKLNKE